MATKVQENSLETERSQEAAFVRSVVMTSLILGIVLINIIVSCISNADSVRSAIAQFLARSGQTSLSAEIADKIVDPYIHAECDYAVAGILYDSGEYEKASELFRKLNTYEESSDRLLQSEYALAGQLAQEGLYDEALEKYAYLGDYSDSKQCQNQIIYKKAELANNNGDLAQAIMLFNSLGDYSDATQKAYDIAFSVTGDDSAAQNMLSSGGLSPEDFSLSLDIAERRAVIPMHSIAAGNYHTVVLRADGTVAACGDNSYGQCNVDGWTEIVQVFAGARHTVGLRADGTVVATGDNTYEQCDVSSWTGVAQVAVNDYNTIALLSDGTVLNCGYNSYDTIERASGITEIYAGCYAAVAATDNGAYLSSHKAYELQPEYAALDVAFNTGYYVTHYTHGLCRFSIEIEEQWERMVCVDAGPTAIIGVDIDGGIKSHFFRASDTVDFSTDKEILQCAAGTGHFVFLAADGSVVAFGDNSKGQCDVSSLS